MFTIKILLCIFIIILSPTYLLASYKEIIDTEGRVVKIPQKINRAVVLTSTCIEAIYIFGAINKVVGISRRMFDNPIYSELIKELKNIPVVSQTEDDVNIEKLLALNPDVLIALGSIDSSENQNKLLERLRFLGIPVVLVDIKSLNDNYYLIELMGKIFNNEKKANELISYMKNIVVDVKQKVQKNLNQKRVRILSVSGAKPTLILGHYWGDNDIRILAGGINVASDIRQFSTVVSLEQINAWNPDVITISHVAKYGPEDILNNPQWKNINAVKNKRVYKNPYHIGGIFTPRVVLILAWYAKRLNPDLDLDWVKISDNFFKKFYGLPYAGPKE